MKQSFSSVVLGFLQSIDGFEVDPATKNPIERVGHDVDSGEISWDKGLDKARVTAKLYRLSQSQMRSLTAILRRNFEK